MSRAPRSYRVGIAGSGRRAPWVASVASVTVEVDVWTSLCGVYTLEGGQQSHLSDTIHCPTVAPVEVSPRGSHAPRDPVGTDGPTPTLPHRVSMTRQLTVRPAPLGRTCEAPASGLVWRLTTDRGSRPRGPRKAMTRDHEKCIHSPPLTPSLCDVSAGDGVLT